MFILVFHLGEWSLLSGNRCLSGKGGPGSSRVEKVSVFQRRACQVPFRCPVRVALEDANLFRSRAAGAALA